MQTHVDTQPVGLSNSLVTGLDHERSVGLSMTPSA